MALRALHLCSGYGGFELALRAFGAQTVAHVERDSYAACVLMERMAETRLDQAPIWDDLESFDGSAWRGRVDIVTAGFPCPDFSSAGLRGGVDGSHWLWPSVARVVGNVGPEYVMLENVPGLVRLGGLTRVLSDLADLGFDAEWGLLSAADVGATHLRERFWLVAHRYVHRLTALPERYQSAESHLEPCGRSLGYADRSGRPEVTRGLSGDEAQTQRHNNGHKPHRASETLADHDSVSRPSRHGPRSHEPESRSANDSVGCSFMGFPPGPEDHDRWDEWINQGGPQPVVRRITDGPPGGLADALHLGGNGLVPQCAEHAIRQLFSRLTVPDGPVDLERS
jgi:DNA (cytosine-5)-methyltransferase 1